MFLDYVRPDLNQFCFEHFQDEKTFNLLAVAAFFFRQRFHLPISIFVLDM